MGHRSIPTALVAVPPSFLIITSSNNCLAMKASKMLSKYSLGYHLIIYLVSPIPSSMVIIVIVVAEMMVSTAKNLPTLLLPISIKTLVPADFLKNVFEVILISTIDSIDQVAVITTTTATTIMPLATSEQCKHTRYWVLGIIAIS